MKKTLIVAFVICYGIPLACAQNATKNVSLQIATKAPDVMVVKGIIIDNMCASGHAPDIAEYVKTHPKECAIMPACVASGFSIFCDGKLMKFTPDSDAAIEEFLKKPESGLQVVVEAKQVGEQLRLVSIKNQ